MTAEPKAAAEGLTEECAAFAAALDLPAIPPSVIRTAKRCLIDTLGVAVKILVAGV